MNINYFLSKTKVGIPEDKHSKNPVPGISHNTSFVFERFFKSKPLSKFFENFIFE